MKSPVLASSAPPSDVAAPEPTANAGTGRWNRPLVLALLTGVGWLVFLGLLALWTANPATLNLQQLSRSEAVIVGRIDDPRTGAVRVAEILRARENSPLQVGDTLTLKPPGSHWASGMQRIFPLTRATDGTWSVTPSPLPKTPWLDYPDEPALKSQILAR